MRSIPTQLPDRQQTPSSTHGFRKTILGWAAAYLAFLAVLLAVSYPVVVGSVLAGATAAVLGGHLLRRRRDHHTRRVCIPATGVCVNV
ncbi:hypothetical protein [Haladaptatus salinisoli]|uniref:hypothetical protein n=1 Tax=Haladaptatus salinisoli TaxID=2884876 RepID=UPI001D0B4C03|nr:hypothetical protein [Haladaptatus salinisoli]